MKHKSNNNDHYAFSLSKSSTLNNNNSYHKFRYNYHNPNKKYNRYFNNNDYYNNNNKYSYNTTYKKTNSHRYKKLSLYDDNEEDLNVYLTQLNQQNYFSKGKNDTQETTAQVHNDVPPKEELFRINVKLSEGNVKDIILYKEDNINEIVSKFCKENNIGNEIEKGLVDKIKSSLSIVETVVSKGKYSFK